VKLGLLIEQLNFTNRAPICTVQIGEKFILSISLSVFQDIWNMNVVT